MASTGEEMLSAVDLLKEPDRASESDGVVIDSAMGLSARTNLETESLGVVTFSERVLVTGI